MTAFEMRDEKSFNIGMDIRLNNRLDNDDGNKYFVTPTLEQSWTRKWLTQLLQVDNFHSSYDT